MFVLRWIALDIEWISGRLVSEEITLKEEQKVSFHPEKYRVLAYFRDRILYTPGYIAYRLFSNCHVESPMEQRHFVKCLGSLKRESQPVLVLGVRKSPKKWLGKYWGKDEGFLYEESGSGLATGSCWHWEALVARNVLFISLVLISWDFSKEETCLSIEKYETEFYVSIDTGSSHSICPSGSEPKIQDSGTSVTAWVSCQGF